MKSDEQISPKDEVIELKRFLSFSLGQEDYAIPLLNVKEVIAVPEITSIPFTPNYFLGIMNLRGQVISVLDLRHKLGIKFEKSKETSVIICDLNPLVVGVVVDSINAVVSPTQSEYSAKPDVQGSQNTDYISGVYRRENKLVLLLEISRALGLEDLRLASKSSATHRAA